MTDNAHIPIVTKVTDDLESNDPCDADLHEFST